MIKSAERTGTMIPNILSSDSKYGSDCPSEGIFGELSRKEARLELWGLERKSGDTFCNKFGSGWKGRRSSYGKPM